MITVALAKGRLMKDFIKYSKSKGTAWQNSFDDINRALVVETDDVRFLLVKGDDVPVYVSLGTADLGITGSDVLLEQNRNVNHLLDLPFGECHFSVAAKEDVAFDNIKTVASKYTKIAMDYFESLEMDVEVIKLNGSVELAALIGMTDCIVDIVQSGETLRMNNLVEKKKMFNINARLISNKHAYFTQSDDIQKFIQALKVTL